MQNELPVKTKTKKNPEEIRNLFWIERDGSLLLWQRPTTSRLMPGFWELPEAAQLPSAKRTVLRGEFQHGITVHNYRFLVWEADTADPGDCIWLKSTDLLALPLSTVVRKALKLGTAMAATSSR